MPVRAPSAVLLPLALCLAACDPAATERETADGPFSRHRDATVRFSAIPDTQGSELEIRFGKVAAHLSEELGVEVVYQPSPDYTSSVEAFAQGDLWFAWFGGLTGVQARSLVPGSEALVQGAEDPEYRTYFIAHRDTGLPAIDLAAEPGPLPVESFRGLRFTFAAARSTSGRLMPQHYLQQATGQTPTEFFGREPGVAGGHHNVVTEVNAGAYDLGALNYRVYERMDAEGAADNVSVVWKTPPYPDYNLTVRGDLDEHFGTGSTTRLREVLLALDDPELLAAFDRSALVPTTNDAYAPIEKVARELGFVE